MFDRSGIQTGFAKNGDNNTVLRGYYPCDHPPNFGFSIPSTSNLTAARQNKSSPVSHLNTVFNIEAEALAMDSTGNNCTAIIQGVVNLGGWIVGQGKHNELYRLKIANNVV